MTTRIDSELLLKVLEATPANQNIMLMGKHGIGKSQILENFFTKKGYKVVTLFLGQMSDPGDLIGIPNKNEETGHTEFMPPYWFPTDDTPVVLFLDELNRARPEVLQTIMDLALNRKLAGRSLPSGSRIISAVNNGEEYQLTDLDPALVSRFNIYEFVPSVQNWILWASQNGIDKRVIDFISLNPSELDSTKKYEEIDNLEKTPDRRGWVRVSDIIKDTSELNYTYKSIISGIVGPVSANHFFEFQNDYHLITGEELLVTMDINKALKKLQTYKTPEIANLNDSIFEFLESKKYLNTKCKTMSIRLAKYYEFLERNNLREAIAHFASMFSSTSYPNALLFMVEYCNFVYTKMTKFVSEIK